MSREEDLDRLIEQRLPDASWLSEASDDEAARLAAAEAVARLNTLEPPPALAERVEARIRAQARAREPQARAQHNGHVPALAFRPGKDGKTRRPAFRRAWIGALSAAAVLLLAVVGVAKAAPGSVPGDPLYGIKRFEQQMALSNASGPAARANVQIAQLQSAVADLETEVGAGRSDADITQALAIVATDTQASQSAVAALPAGADRDAAARALAAAFQQEQAALYRLLARVDWAQRLAFTRQLGALGAAVPTVTRVTVSEASDDTLTLRLTGTNFAPGARLVVNGAPQGAVSQQNATSLTATLSESAWHDDQSAVGVLNPDGTAAQKIISDDGHHGGSGSGGDDHGGQGTPGSTPTPGGDGGHGGDGGSGSGSSDGSGSGSGDDGGGN